MELFDWGRLLHSGVGTLALVSFWVAGLAQKGSPVHRRAGRVYLISLVGVMGFATLMVAARVQGGQHASALFFAYLISIVASASWLTWFSVRRRREPERLVGTTYRALATWLVAIGIVVFATGVARGSALTMFLALLGLGVGAHMWRLALARVRDCNWWRAHHLNGAMLSFIAVHDSFLTIGLGTLIPEVRAGVPRMLVAVGVTTIALALRAWFARREHGAARQSVAATSRAA
jgi:hypothetical protein